MQLKLYLLTICLCNWFEVLCHKNGTTTTINIYQNINQHKVLSLKATWFKSCATTLIGIFQSVRAWLEVPFHFEPNLKHKFKVTWDWVNNKNVNTSILNAQKQGWTKANKRKQNESLITKRFIEDKKLRSSFWKKINRKGKHVYSKANSN